MAADRVNESEWRRWNDERWTAAWPQRERLTNTVTPHLLQAMALQPGERVLDIGCGGGGLTIAGAEAVGPDGAIVGVDLSTSLLDLATQRAAAAGASNVSFVVVDAQTAQIPGAPFDVAASQFGVMFFDEPVTAFANIAAHLRPGARLVFVCWQSVERNPWHTSGALRPFLPPAPPPAAGKSVGGPFAFGDDAYTTAILVDAGFTDVRSDTQETTVDAPMNAVFEDWQLDFLGVPTTQQAEARAAALDHVAQFQRRPRSLPVPARLQGRAGGQPGVAGYEKAAADCSVSSEPRKYVIFPSTKRHQCCMSIAARLPVRVHRVGPTHRDDHVSVVGREREWRELGDLDASTRSP